MPEEWGKHLEMQFTLARGRGFLQVQEEGGKIRLYGELPEDGRGIYKGRIQGPGGGAYLAGTFLPEGEKLCLRRVMSREMLKDLGVWPVTGGGAGLSPGQTGRGGACPDRVDTPFGPVRPSGGSPPLPGGGGRGGGAHSPCGRRR